MSVMRSFRARFEAMVEELLGHPAIEVYEVFVGGPAPEVAIREAEEAIGTTLPADIVDFYRRHNGVFLEWGLRGRTYEYHTDQFGYPDYGAPPGCINLLPIYSAMSPGWEMDSHVNEIQPDHQELLFGAALDPQPPVRSVCVDNFSKYNHGDLVIGPEPVMVVSTDHGADMDSSDFCSFATYLDCTLACFGANRYHHGLGIGWTRQPRRVDAWTAKPDLEALLEKLRKNEHSS